MTFAAVVTLIGVALTVLALAGYLIYVALVLKRVDSRLGDIAGGIVGINGKAGPVGPVVLEINRDLAGVDAALQGVLNKKRPPKGAQPQAAQPQAAQAPARTQSASPLASSPAPPTGPIRTAIRRIDPFKR